MQEQQFSRILDAVYDTVTSFDRWQDALERIGEAFGCSYAGLIDRNLNTMEGRAVAFGVDAAGQREYFDVWSTRDILRQWTPAYRAGMVETDHDILPRKDLLASDYYNGFMKPRDMHAVMRMTLVAEPGYRRIISMSRPASLGDYDRDDLDQCRRLMPHLQRAARVMQRVEESNVTLSGFSGVLEQSPTGVLLLDRTGKLLFTNRAARTMAATNDGFTLRNDGIKAVNQAEDGALQRLIAAATGRLARPEAPRGGVMRLSRKSGKPAFALAGAPLHGDAFSAETAPAAFILITDAASGAPKPLLRELFGLTDAEARVAERLMQGDTPEQAAITLGVKTSTARWHLAALYRKTGTNRQAQLVRLLMSVPRI
jgi:DNA-binding CsgD family transcriptional regulator/PAS domain-containing protein